MGAAKSYRNITQDHHNKNQLALPQLVSTTIFYFHILSSSNKFSNSLLNYLLNFGLR